jgi:hypothetical protein
MPLPTPQPLSSSDITYLRDRANSGTIQGIVDYYQRLSDRGYAYGDLAIGVVLDNTASGSVARDYAENIGRLTGTNPDITSAEWEQISIALAEADFVAREIRFNNGDTTPELTVDDYQRYHEDVFFDIAQLPKEAWTAYAPTTVGKDTFAERQAAWEELLESATTGGVSEYLDGLQTLGWQMLSIINISPNISLEERTDALQWLAGMFASPNIFGGALFQNYVLNPLIGDFIQQYAYLFNSPIVVDLQNNGLSLISRANAANNVFYDFEGKGFAKDVGWITPSEAFLVRDVNGNGVIDNVTEMFGDNAGTTAFAKLKALDTNNNNYLLSSLCA